MSGEPGRLALRPGPQCGSLRHVTALEKSTAERFKEPAAAKAGVAANRGKVRRFMQFYDAAESWSRVERIIARVEAGSEGTDTRFIVTNLEGGRAKHLYERLYCARGQAENHIKSWKNHLAADRTSCHTAEANQFRLFLHAGAYWLLWSMRRVMPKRSTWRVMQFDTLRLRLIKIAARVVELKTQLKIHLPSSAPDQAIFAMLLARLPRLDHLRAGAFAPEIRPLPFNLQRRPDPNPKNPPAAATIRHARRCQSQPKREPCNQRFKDVLSSCIDRAKSVCLILARQNSHRIR